MRYTKSILQFSLSWDVWPFIECAGLPHSAPSFLPHQHMSRAAHLPMMYSTHNDGLVHQGSRQHLAVADHHKATTYNLPGQYKQAYPPSHTVQGYKQAPASIWHKQRFLTPGHQGWNDLHSLCRIGMEYYLLNNDDNNIIYWIMMIIMIMMMIIIMIIMMTMMIIGTATIMIMIIIITTTLTMTIMKMIMIKTAQTPCQSLYKDRRI